MKKWLSLLMALCFLLILLSGCSEDNGDDDEPEPEIVIASASASNTISYPGEEVTFSGKGSNGTDLTYSWNFDDGSTGKGIEAKHAFSKPGKYSVTLTVENNEGVEDTAVWVLHVHELTSHQDTLTPLAGKASYNIVVNPTSQGFKVNLTYPSGTLNSVVLSILYPNGTVHETSAGAERDPGDTQSVEYEVSWRFLADEGFEDWSAEILLSAGMSVECTVAVEVYY
jgi:PKD repeat protein